MEHLPPSSAQTQELPKENPPVSVPIPPNTSLHNPAASSPRGRKRYAFVGWVFWALIFAVAGFGTGYALLPHISPNTVGEMLSTHLPLPDTPLSVVFLRLLLASLPVGLILCSAAFTGFSSTLISLVLCWRGFIEGFTVCALAGMTAASSSQRLLSVFIIWTAFRFSVRLSLAISARRTATAYFSAHQETPTALRPLYLRHLARSLGGCMAAALGCLLYAVCLIYFV